MLQISQDIEQDDSRSFRLQVGSSLAHSPPGDACIFLDNKVIAFSSIDADANIFTSCFNFHVHQVTGLSMAALSNTILCSPLADHLFSGQ